MIPAVTGKGDSPLAGEIIVFDLETTGLSAATERIIEIGAVKLNNLTVVDEFSCFVDPERTLGPQIIQLTGITDDMLKGAPRKNRPLPFLQFCGSDQAFGRAQRAL
jgi:DNA polymerase-3 subunit alpha (Gram-positive type)